MAVISQAQIIQKYKETHPETPVYTEFTVGKQTFKIKHPLYRTREETHRITAVGADAGTDELVRAIMGDEQYEKFVAAGGEDNVVLMLLQMLQENTLPKMSDVDAEGKPTTR